MCICDRVLSRQDIMKNDMMGMLEAQYWAWKGNYERNRKEFYGAYDLWACGCPSYELAVEIINEVD